MDIITFGKKEKDIDYISRPAVYSVIFNNQNDTLAIIQTSDGNFFLPGGGIEGNETHEECLKREALEEMGWEVKIGDFIGQANRYFYSTNELRYYLSEGYFYKCNLVNKIGKPTEEDHFLKWVTPSKAIKVLFHEHQSWTVKEALKK